MFEFITRLLTVNPEERLGARERGDVEDLKVHGWLRTIDWKLAMAKELSPPFVPDSKKANFDATHELEELLLEENPLKAKPKKKKDTESRPSDASNMSLPEKKLDKKEEKVREDMELMEKKFTVFDYTKQAKVPTPATISLERPTGAPVEASAGESGHALAKSRSAINLALQRSAHNLRVLFNAGAGSSSGSADSKEETQRRGRQRSIDSRDVDHMEGVAMEIVSIADSPAAVGAGAARADDSLRRLSLSAAATAASTTPRVMPPCIILVTPPSLDGGCAGDSGLGVPPPTVEEDEDEVDGGPARNDGGGGACDGDGSKGGAATVHFADTAGGAHFDSGRSSDETEVQDAAVEVVGS
ncbi:hypothetical protein HK405_008926 [Cladochytrium tenue]|nr:hypothetical protein HK405_008926 [Cladochytrium tenue]